MEMDHLKPEEQVEIMMMMQQREKVPQFSDELLSPCANGAYVTSHSVDSVLPSMANLNLPSAASISFSPTTSVPPQEPTPKTFCKASEKQASMTAMREMIFRIAAMQPIHIDPESVKPPKRRNIKISKDPQSVAARHRRERISERIRILQRLVPGGTKMDTASMLDEAIHYVKFLKTQVQYLERAAATRPHTGIGFPVTMAASCYNPRDQLPHNVQHRKDN